MNRQGVKLKGSKEDYMGGLEGGKGMGKCDCIIISKYKRSNESLKNFKNI